MHPKIGGYDFFKDGERRAVPDQTGPAEDTAGESPFVGLLESLSGDYSGPTEDAEVEPLADWERELLTPAAPPQFKTRANPSLPYGVEVRPYGEPWPEETDQAEPQFDSTMLKPPAGLHLVTEPDGDQADALKPFDLSDVPTSWLETPRPLNAKLPRVSQMPGQKLWPDSAPPVDDHTHAVGGYVHTEELGRKQAPKPRQYLPPSEWPQLTAEESAEIKKRFRDALTQESAPVIAISTGDNPAEKRSVVYDRPGPKPRSYLSDAVRAAVQEEADQPATPIEFDTEPYDDGHTHAVGGYVRTEEIGRERTPKPWPSLPPAPHVIVPGYPDSERMMREIRRAESAATRNPIPDALEALRRDADALNADQQRLSDDYNQALFGPPQPIKPRPRVRVVHHGGPARLAKVFIDGRVAPDVDRILIRLDAKEHKPTAVWVKFEGAEIDVAGELTGPEPDTYDTPSPRLLALAGVAVTSLPTALAWAWRAQSWWLPAAGFWLAVTSAAVVLLGTILATVGAIRQAKRDDEGDDQ